MMHKKERGVIAASNISVDVIDDICASPGQKLSEQLDAKGPD